MANIVLKEYGPIFSFRCKIYQFYGWKWRVQSYLWSSVVSPVASQQEGVCLFQTWSSQLGPFHCRFCMFTPSLHGFSSHNPNTCKLNELESKLFIDVNVVAVVCQTCDGQSLQGVFLVSLHMLKDILVTHLFSSLSRQSLHSDLLNKHLLPLWHSPLPHHKVLILTSASDWPARMSQLQFQCSVSPMTAASAPLQLGQPQPGYSIPCASGTLPSESASQPMRSSALPAGSATPYNTTTGWLLICF